MSFTPDGQVHYYAHPGVDDLTEADHMYSSFPYGTRCMYFDNFFVNVANWDNGKNWSTPWVIDDPAFYVIPPEGMTVADLPRRRSRSSSSKGGISTALKRFGRNLKR